MRLVDNLITFRILHLLLQPIEKSDAYTYGIVDKNGNKIRNPKSNREMDSYTILNRLAFKLKQILKRTPSAERDLEKLSVSLHVMKECYERDIVPDNMEYIFEQSLPSVTSSDIQYIESLLEDAPVNNASATQGVAGFTPEDVGINKNKILRRKQIKTE